MWHKLSRSFLSLSTAHGIKTLLGLCWTLQISILYDYLEKNSSIESLVDFKTMAKEEFRILSKLLCGWFPTLSIENAVKFLNMQLAASIGLNTMTNLSKAQQKVLENPEFEHFKVDYNIYFKEAVEYLLQGLLNDK